MLASEITYFDFAQLDYASYFLTGLLEAEREMKFHFRVSRTVPEFLAEPRMGEWRDILFSVLLFQIRKGARRVYFCIDTRDSWTADAKAGRGYHLPLLAEVDWYFKVNYREEAVQNEPVLIPHARKIVPLGSFFPIRPPSRFQFRPRLRAAPETGWTLADAWKRVAHLRSLIPLESLRRLRGAAPDTDVFFVVYHYGGKHAVDDARRLSLMRELRKVSGYRIETGFSATSELGGEFAEFRLPPSAHGEFVKKQSHSRLGIYVRGLHQCVSFKLGQLLAMGKPIVGQPIINHVDWYYRHDYFHEQFAFESPEEIAERCQVLLGQKETLRRWGEANVRTFETYFTPRRVVEPILEHVL
jgi:hypothetical protein